MAINDILSNLLTKTGLKKTDEQKCTAAIAALEEDIRNRYDELECKVDEARRLEGRIRQVKEQYDKATPASKKLLEAQLKSLMGDFRHLQERQGLTLRNIEKSKLLLQNKRIELENLHHPADVVAIEEAAETKDDILSELKREDREIASLKEKTYVREEEEPEEKAVGAVYDKVKEDALNREFDALFGESKDSSTEEKMSDPEPEIA